MCAVCGGDEGAGNALFKRHFAAVYRFLEHKVDGDADEVVQDTFLACVKSRDRFRRQSSFRTFLFAIARHTLYAHLRRRASKGTTIDFEEISLATITTSARGKLARGQDRSRLLAALRDLPVEQQLILANVRKDPGLVAMCRGLLEPLQAAFGEAARLSGATRASLATTA